MSATKYHISPDTGRPNICRAGVRACPIGGEHYDSREEARAGYEKQMDEATDALRGIQKETRERREAKAAEAAAIDAVADEIAEAAWWDARKDVAGLEIVNRDSGAVESFTSMSKGELEMPGYLESVEKGYEGTEWEARRLYRNAPALDEEQEYCFVCHRPTDHVGEHDELVDAGMAEYRGAEVLRTDTYDEAAAKAVSDASYAAYELRFRVVDPANDSPQVASLKEEYARLKNSPGHSHHGFPEDEQTRYNLQQAMKRKQEEIQALQPEWDPKDEDNLAQAEKKLAAAVANARFQSNPETALKPLPSYKLPAAGEKRTLHDVVVVRTQYKRELREGEPEYMANYGTHALIVPNLSTLTVKRKAALADEVALRSGRNLEEWSKIPDVEKARLIDRNITRHKEFTLETGADGKVSYGSRYNHSNGLDPQDVKLTNI